MPPKGRGKSKLPVPLPEGMIMEDTEKNVWKLGKIIGQGGFGLIYLAYSGDTPVEDDAVHVIKVEYHENGPLFCELNFYQRAAKQEHIKKWMDHRSLQFLGIPVFWGSGLAKYNGRSYRFMVMERLGIDLQRILDSNGHPFKKETVLQLGARMLDALEYIHEKEYVHGDIKAANLLLGYTNPNKVYLADYGLSYRYCPNGNHKQYKENPKKGHNGTIEFTSLDAHKGVAPSRRSDLEILGYCMLQWLCGKLPWEKNLKDPAAVQTAKMKLMDELPDSVMKLAPSGSSCGEIAEFLARVCNLAYEEKPDYQVLKKILVDGLKSSGIRYNGPLEFSTAGYALNLCASKASKVDLPKPPRKHDLPKLPPQYNCMRKAGSRVTQTQLQQQEKPVGLNKTRQHNEALLVEQTGEELRNKPLKNPLVLPKQTQLQQPSVMENTMRQHHRHDPQRIFSDVNHQQNRIMYTPVSLQETSSDFNSYVYKIFRLTFIELCKYTTTIVLLLILIFFSLYFL